MISFSDSAFASEVMEMIFNSRWCDVNPEALSSSMPGRSPTSLSPKCVRKLSVTPQVAGNPGERLFPRGLIQPISRSISRVPLLRDTPLISSISARVIGWW